MSDVLLTTPSLLPQAGGPAYSVRRLHEVLKLVGVSSRLHAAQCPRGTEICGLVSSLAGAGTPGLVHDNGIWLPFNHRVRNFASARGIPRIVSPRGMLEPWALRHHRLRKRLAWHLYQRRDLLASAALHATSDQEAANIRALDLRRPIAIVPNGVDLPDGVGGRLSGGSGVRIALCVSRLHPKKGIPLLLSAWGRLRPPGWRLVVAGPAEASHDVDLRQQANRAGLSDIVSIRGMVSGAEKDTLFRDAALFVLPSYSENFGLVIAEALSYALPVITTHGTPWREIRERRCGWWVAPNEDALHAALAEATTSPAEELIERGRRGRLLIEGSYAWPGIAERMLRLYEWIRGRGPRPAFVVD